MQLIRSESLKIASSRSNLAFTTTGGSNYEVWDRYISIGGEPLFHIGNVCGTCAYFFRRLTESGVSSVEVERIKSALESGLSEIDSTARAFSELLPNGKYVVALFECVPHLAGSGGTPDYFLAEQRLTWPDCDDGPAVQTGYYRAESIALPDEQMLFEFLVPSYDVGQLNVERVEHYKSLIDLGQRPTACSLSVLDIKSPSLFPEDPDGNEIEPEFKTHWCFANYLLDGHHKIHAAHALGMPITLLSFIAVDHSWPQVGELIQHYTARQRTAK